MQCAGIEQGSFLFLNVAGWVGLVSSVLLLMRSLSGSQRHAVLRRLVAGLATADLLINLSLFVPSWVEQQRLLVFPSVGSGCKAWSYFSWSLIVWSELLSAAIAISILLAFLGWASAVDKMRWAPVVLLPVAYLGNAYMLLLKEEDQAGQPNMPENVKFACIPSPVSYAVSGAELVLLFTVVSSVTIYGHIHFLYYSPPTVAKRALACSTRYMIACATIWSVKVASFFFSKVGSGDESCNQWAWAFMGDGFIYLSGLWNLLAYQGMDFRLPQAVRFTSSSDLLQRDRRQPEGRDRYLDSWLLLLAEEDSSRSNFSTVAAGSGLGGGELSTALSRTWAPTEAPP